MKEITKILDEIISENDVIDINGKKYVSTSDFYSSMIKLAKEVFYLIKRNKNH